MHLFGFWFSFFLSYLQLSEIVNQGQLVSDEIIMSLLSKRLAEGQAKGESGFILDGFPRTIKQAVSIFVLNRCLPPHPCPSFKELFILIVGSYFQNKISIEKWHLEICITFPWTQEILEGVTDIDLVVNLKIREEALLAKCLGRRTCSQCGGNFNIASINIKGENGCPGISMAPLLPPEHCMSKLITRSDDTEPVVKERLRIYNELVLSSSYCYCCCLRGCEPMAS